MKNDIIVINNISLVKFHNEDFYFDEYRIYDNSFIEFYINGNIAIYIEYEKIKISNNKTGKLIRAYYGPRKMTDYDMIDLYINMKTKEEKLYNVGDIIIRKNFNTKKDIKTSYETYRDENTTSDATMLFLLGIDKETKIFDKLTEEEINTELGWRIIEKINDRFVRIKHDTECFELIENITTFNEIKKEVEEWGD